MKIDKIVLLNAIDKWGCQSQIFMAIEEMAELTKELSKWYRKEESTEKILEEIADVIIMIEQIKIMFAFRDSDIQDAINKKIKQYLQDKK